MPKKGVILFILSKMGYKTKQNKSFGSPCFWDMFRSYRLIVEDNNAFPFFLQEGSDWIGLDWMIGRWPDPSALSRSDMVYFCICTTIYIVIFLFCIDVNKGEKVSRKESKVLIPVPQ